MKKVLSCIVLVTSLAFSQTADEIMDKMTQATVGDNAQMELQSMRVTGSMSAPNGLSGTVTAVSKLGNKVYVQSTIAMGSQKLEMVQACDGTDCYENNPLVGARIITGDERETVLQQNDLEGLTDWRKSYASAELLGEEDINGSACFKLKLVTEGGLETVQFVDKGSYRAVRTDMTMKSDMMGEIKSVTYLSEYQDFNGFTLPTKITTEAMTQQMVFSIDSYEFNVEIPDSKFAIPDHLKVAQ